MCGRGARGSTINVPLAADYGDAELKLVFDEIVMPAATAFNAGAVFISCGFDAMANDGIAGGYRFNVTAPMYGWMTTELMTLGRPVLAVLEGGYNEENLATGAAHVVAALTGSEFDVCGQEPRGDAKGAKAVVKSVLAAHRAQRR